MGTQSWTVGRIERPTPGCLLIHQTVWILDFGSQFVGFPTPRNLIISNGGTDDLVISAASIDGTLVTASVWHRPLIPDSDKQTLSLRQANATVAALRRTSTCFLTKV